jgi:hypothetical protein
MPDFGIMRGFNDKLFGNKLYAGQLPTQLGLIGSSDFGTDPDAQAFFDRVTAAGGALSATEKTAIDTLVKQMKTDGIWTKMKAIYPMVGASAAACAQNLKSASFTGTFTSGWTFASTGVTPLLAYMDTGFNPTTQIANNNTGSYGIYSRTDRADNFSAQHGAVDGLGFVLFILKASSKIQNFHNSDAGTNITNTNSQGFYQMTRDSSTNTYHTKNSTINTVSLTAKGRPNINLYIGARNNTSGVPNAFDTIEVAFAYYSDQSLTTTNLSNYYTAVQAFQTTLSRQV